MLKYNGWKIYFRHRQEEGAPGRSTCGWTACYIRTDSGAPVGGGMAICSRRDQFSKSKGRKLALARALQAAVPDKQIRSDIWKLYRETAQEIGLLRGELEDASSLGAPQMNAEDENERAALDLLSDFNAELPGHPLCTEGAHTFMWVNQEESLTVPSGLRCLCGKVAHA